MQRARAGIAAADGPAVGGRVRASWWHRVLGHWRTTRAGIGHGTLAAAQRVLAQRLKRHDGAATLMPQLVQLDRLLGRCGDAAFDAMAPQALRRALEQLALIDGEGFSRGDLRRAREAPFAPLRAGGDEARLLRALRQRLIEAVAGRMGDTDHGAAAAGSGAPSRLLPRSAFGPPGDGAPSATHTDPVRAPESPAETPIRASAASGSPPRTRPTAAAQAVAAAVSAPTATVSPGAGAPLPARRPARGSAAATPSASRRPVRSPDVGDRESRAWAITAPTPLT